MEENYSTDLSSTTTSMPKQTNAATEEEQQLKKEEHQDMFSELPDELLHHILSFLHMKFVMRTSSLSRRWRHVWSSLPFLNFSDMSYPCSDVDFVNRVLMMRNPSANVQTFCFSSKVRRNNVFESIYTWAGFLARHNVEELDIKISCYFRIDGWNKLPDCLFTCKSLTTLTLRTGSRRYPQLFYLPTSSNISLPSLKTLHLKYMKFQYTDNFFSSCCPVLETLILWKCCIEFESQLTISALQLKTLAVNKMMFKMQGGYNRLKVVAPKLTWYSCRATAVSELTLMNSSALVNVEMEKIYKSSEKYVSGMKGYADDGIECLRGICHVKSLVFPVCLLQDVYEINEVEFGTMLPTFCNLTSMKLTSSVSRDQYRAVPYFLEKCPNLETLIIEMYTLKEFMEPAEEVKHGKEGWESELPMQYILLKLKFVHIWNAKGTANECELLKLLLRNAMFLQKMTISTYAYKDELFAREAKIIFTAFKMELLICPRVSSSVEISFINN